MGDETRTGTTRAVPMVSLGLAVLAATLGLVGLPVMVAPGDTERFFAWTIDVPLTAAFLGACYWTAAVFSLLSARAGTWASARVAMPGVMVAGTLILAATLVHLDRFAMDTVRGWIWLVLYAGLLPGALLLLAIQRRAGAVDPPLLRPLGRRQAAALGAAGALLLAPGAALFAVPQTSAEWWPWPLTELTARMVGAWLAAVAVTLLAALHARDRTRGRPAMVYVALVALSLLATLARDPDAVAWEDPAAWLYLAGCAVLLSLALHGLAALRASRGVEAAQAPARRRRAGA